MYRVLISSRMVTHVASSWSSYRKKSVGTTRKFILKKFCLYAPCPENVEPPRIAMIVGFFGSPCVKCMRHKEPPLTEGGVWVFAKRDFDGPFYS